MRIPNVTFRAAHPSNHWHGRGGYTLKYFTVHHTAGFESSLYGLYSNPERDGSATFFAGVDVREQYLDTDDTPWTNGNSVSNRESVTCETRGLWLNGYINMDVLANLEEIMYQCLLVYPDLQLTYHMDVSNTPTACPGDLKHKGYALAAWNRAKARTKGEDDVIKKEDIGAIRIIMSEVEGWNGHWVHAGKYDDKIISWVGKTWTEFINHAWNAQDTHRIHLEDKLGSQGKVVAAANKQIATQKESIETLSSRPTNAEYQAAIDATKAAQNALALAVEEAEALKKVEIEAPIVTVPPEPVNDWDILWATIKRIFSKKES